MGLLAELMAETGSQPVATLATPATPSPGSSKVANVAGCAIPDTGAIRARLLALTDAEYRDPALVRALSESFLRGCDGMGDLALRALLSMLADAADRRVLKRPKGDTAGILCRKCGPVWVHPSIARVLPVVDGWPRALGCPWCFIHPKDGRCIPRPTAPGLGAGDSR